MSTTSRWVRLADIPETRWPRVPPFVSTIIAVVLVLTSVVLPLLSAWDLYTLSDGYQESHGAANLAHPDAADCEIARTIVTDMHGVGRDRQLLRMFGGTKLSLATFAYAWDKPAALPAGYSVAGADADWRWCAGLGRSVRDVGWVRLGDVLRQQTEVNISRPAYSAARDEAVAWVDAVPDPLSADGWVGPDRRSAINGNLVFLKRDPRTGAWTIVGRGPAT